MMLFRGRPIGSQSHKNKQWKGFDGLHRFDRRKRFLKRIRAVSFFFLAGRYQQNLRFADVASALFVDVMPRLATRFVYVKRFSSDSSTSLTVVLIIASRNLVL